MKRRKRRRTVWCRSCGKPHQGKRKDPCPHCSHQVSETDAPSDMGDLLEDEAAPTAWSPLETGRLEAVKVPTPPVVNAPALASRTIHIQCECGKVFATSAANAGKTGRCASCGTRFQIPLVTSTPSEFAALPEDLRAFARTAPAPVSSSPSAPPPPKSAPTPPPKQDLAAPSPTPHRAPQSAPPPPAPKPGVAAPSSTPSELELKVRFTCSCGRGFETSASNAGKQGTCATCGQGFVVPAASAPSSGPLAQLATPAASPTDEKECPDCAELVKARARICRFCGHTFGAKVEPLPAPAQPNSPAAELPKQEPSPPERTEQEPSPPERTASGRLKVSEEAVKRTGRNALAGLQAAGGLAKNKAAVAQTKAEILLLTRKVGEIAHGAGAPLLPEDHRALAAAEEALGAAQAEVDAAQTKSAEAHESGQHKLKAGLALTSARGKLALAQGSLLKVRQAAFLHLGRSVVAGDVSAPETQEQLERIRGLEEDLERLGGEASSLGETLKSNRKALAGVAAIGVLALCLAGVVARMFMPSKAELSGVYTGSIRPTAEDIAKVSALGPKAAAMYSMGRSERLTLTADGVFSRLTSAAGVSAKEKGKWRVTGFHSIQLVSSEGERYDLRILEDGSLRLTSELVLRREQTLPP